MKKHDKENQLANAMGQKQFFLVVYNPNEEWLTWKSRYGEITN
ncbi:hypothetical protein QNH39_12375 [Neobacillus novalis]|uniref:Uncharacterized protein n=1 Tax=Neobacillus novalis TaxID=220687 RepID=A0AA95MWC8_9BACI|nr:hypothetical protein [Neobacillus novalis]WHY88581.1 hypothetical protein QNH39_12375 [Neobacillus novalis]